MTHSPDSNAREATLPSDRDLLRRFIYDGDEPSFAAIVERHSSLVMSVCRRVVGQSPDVDDAFQATFFALSQRPVSIYECLSLSGWLYSVAWRASVRLVRLRKRTMTQPLPDQVPTSEPDPLDVIAQSNDLASLDEELNQLPQKYRDVLVMSYFAQQTNQEIADQLNESKGAIDGRIRDARRMLRVRLARRGVEVGVLAVAAAYVQSSASAASPALIQKAISLGAPGLISQELAALNAAEVAQMKFLTSTGVPLMSKIGLTITAGLVLATGLWGMTRLAAFQDGVAGGGAGGGGAAAVLDATAENAAKGDEATVELSGRTEAAVADDNTAGTDTTPEASGLALKEPLLGGESGVLGRDGSGMGSGDTPAAKPRRKLNAVTGEFSRLSEREADRRMNEVMHEDITADFSFPGENPLPDILESLANASTIAYDFRLGIYPDISALDEDSVVLADVMIRDLEITKGSMTIGSFLDYTLSQTDPTLTWIVRDGLLLITTENAAESDEYMMLRSYDISRLRENVRLNVMDWTGGQSNGPSGGGFFSVPFTPNQLGGTAAVDQPPGNDQAAVHPRLQRTLRSIPQGDKSKSGDTKQETGMTWEAGLLQTVHSFTSPPCRWFDVDGEGGRMSVAGNRLLVRQSRKGHEQVVAVLEQLEMAAEDAAEVAE